MNTIFEFTNDKKRYPAKEKMTKEEIYNDNENIVKKLQESDKIISQLKQHIIKLEGKCQKMDNFFQEFEIDGYDMLVDIVKTYKAHVQNVDKINLFKKQLVTGDQISEKYPIHIFPNKNNKCYEYAAGELCNKVKYNYTMKKMIDNDDKTTLKDICKYILESEKTISKNSNTKDYNIEKKIKRCHYLYD